MTPCRLGRRRRRGVQSKCDNAVLVVSAMVFYLFDTTVKTGARPCSTKDVDFSGADRDSALIPLDCTELYLLKLNTAESAKEWGVWNEDPAENTSILRRRGSQVASALSSLVNLNRLVCSNIPLGDDGAANIAKMVGQHAASALTHVQLKNAAITDKGAAILGKALETADFLEVLNLEGNSIADAATFVIAEALLVNTVLKTLDLSRNPLSDSSAAAIADSLKVAESTSLAELVLSHNTGLGDATAARLAYALQNNNVLTSIVLIGNRVTERGVRFLNTALEVNTALQTLEIDGSLVEDYAFAPWAELRSTLRARRHGECASADIFRTSSISTAGGRQHSFATWAAVIPPDCTTINLSEQPIGSDLSTRGLAAFSLANALAAAFPKTATADAVKGAERDNNINNKSHGKNVKDGMSGRNDDNVNRKGVMLMLRKIDLRFNHIGNAGASLLAATFNTLGPSNIDYIDLRNNNFDGRNALNIVTAISTNLDLLKTLKVLYVRDDENMMSDNPHSKRDPHEL